MGSPLLRNSWIAGVLVHLSLCLLVTGADAADPLRAPFDLDATRRLARPTSAFVCPPPLEGVAGFSGQSTPYYLKDPTQSRIDPERASRNADRQKQLMAMLSRMGSLSDSYIGRAQPDPAIQACAVDQFTVWARGSALLGGIKDNDELGRHAAIIAQAWHLGAYANAYLKLELNATGSDTGPTKAWFEKLATSVMQEYQGINHWIREGANHLYWSGFAVATAGVALDDPKMLDFGMMALRRAVGGIEPAGYFRAEMGRGPRSMTYQHFALIPVAGILRIAEANGRKLDAESERKLIQAFRFIATATANPQMAEQFAKAELLPTYDRTNLAWVDMVLPWVRTRDRELADQLETLIAAKPLRPFGFVYVGGTISSLYNPAGARKPDR